ncbi:MAG: hypothetical protein U1F09_10000 [Steroidobacteraceae bacterium]
MLRRLIHSARRQDWFAVVVELVVVVLGIFIGMQVTNWNEDRKLARQALEYRQSLEADFAADELSMRGHAAYFEVVSAYGRQALDLLERPRKVTDPSEAAQLVTAFMIASSVWEYRQPRPTYDDLKSTGNLPLLGDTAFRVSLINYYTGIDSASVQLDVVTGYRQHVRSIIPAAAQVLIRAECEQVASGDRLGLVMKPHCDPDLTRWDPLAVLAEIVQSPGIKGDLTLWMSQLGLKIQLFKLEADNAAAMRAKLTAPAQR